MLGEEVCNVLDIYQDIMSAINLVASLTSSLDHYMMTLVVLNSIDGYPVASPKALCYQAMLTDRMECIRDLYRVEIYISLMLT